MASATSPEVQASSVIQRDERTLSPVVLTSLPCARALALDELLPSLTSPDSAATLQRDPASGHLVDSDGHVHALRGELPLLIPARLNAFYTDHLTISEEEATDAFLQYFFLSAVKQSGVVGEINASSDDVHYQRHLFRMREFLGAANGLVLDVGCDDPAIGAGLLPPTVRYVGLDPFCRRPQPFRVVGFGEYLPFRTASVDGVVFNTSLDHILDWRRALAEAWRVLVPGGSLFIATLVWTDNADLLSDAVHFHHFRDYEIYGALDGWQITSERRYDYKGASHRHGLYVSARKAERPLAAG